LRGKVGNFTVTFQPSGKSAVVPQGSTLLDASARAGIFIETPCGGQGRCGRCLVKLDSGQLSHRENPHLAPPQIEQGWVLACTAQPLSDVAVTNPVRREREKVALETAASRSAAPVRCDWPLYPAVRQYFIDVPPPSLENNATDLDRLQRALTKKHGLGELQVGLPLLKNLAQALRQANWQATAVIENRQGQARLIDLRPGQQRGPLLGLAVDIGTTNVVAYLADLRTGRLIGQAATRNKQGTRGEDIISRIIYSERGSGLEELRQMVVDTINGLLQELAQQYHFAPGEMEEMVVAGNTTMTQLFLGLPPRYIRSEPYVPTASHFPLIRAGELGLGINPEAPVYCLPAVAAYVGGDTVAGVLSSCLFKTDKLTLFLDIGTNGEIVLGNADWMTCCACSAGPAFEGAGVRCGMRAIRGAIEEVKINSQTLEPTITVIGKVRPLGICGSGLISALAEMFITGVIERSGRIDMEHARSRMKTTRVRQGEHGPEYVLAWAKDSGSGEDIVLTEVDINNLLRTKAAIYAGISVMLRNVGIKSKDIEEVLIGGAFGQHLNVEEAIQIGLLPDLPWDRFKFLGNTSAWGAYSVLLSQHAQVQGEEVAGKLTYLELVADSSFMDELTAALFLPHTNLDNFPSVKALLERGGRAAPLTTSSSVPSQKETR